MKKNQSHENDLTIWSHFIKAQSKLIERLCSPIHLLPPANKVDSKGLVEVQIDQDFNRKEVLSLIKKHFTKIKEEDIFLENGYFLLDNDNVPSPKKLEEFAIDVKKFYIEFNPFPTVEGKLKDLNSPLKELTNLLRAEQIEIEFNREGEMLLPLKAIDIFDKQNRIQREQKIGAIYKIKIAHDKLIASTIENLLLSLNIPKEKFNIIPHEYKIYTTDAIFTKGDFCKLNSMIGLMMQNCIIKVWVNQRSFSRNWQQCHLKEDVKTDENSNYYYEFYTSNNKLIFEDEQITNDEYLMLSYYSILSYYGKNGIIKIEKSYIFDYQPNSTLALWNI